MPIKLTINNQNYTDEEKVFYFFNPPQVLDVKPLTGPMKGGTKINFYGSQFEKKNITCEFGNVNVTGKFISKSQIQCVAPPNLGPGNVKLRIRYSKDKFASEPVTYHYTADPVISSLQNACGPVDGYTQFTVTGKNFEETSSGISRCIFNNTHSMNATLINTNTLICDSPPLEASEGGDMWYNVSISLDGQTVFPAIEGKFNYYLQP